jgi:hypothetical protein
MNKFSIVLNGSRGYSKGLGVVQSDLNVVDFCKELLDNKIDEMKGDFDSLVELDSFVKEFCEIGRQGGGSWAVVFGEDSWYEVVQV